MTETQTVRVGDVCRDQQGRIGHVRRPDGQQQELRWRILTALPEPCFEAVPPADQLDILPAERLYELRDKFRDKLIRGPWGQDPLAELDKRQVTVKWLSGFRDQQRLAIQPLDSALRTFYDLVQAEDLTDGQTAILAWWVFELQQDFMLELRFRRAFAPVLEARLLEGDYPNADKLYHDFTTGRRLPAVRALMDAAARVAQDIVMWGELPPRWLTPDEREYLRGRIFADPS